MLRNTLLLILFTCFYTTYSDAQVLRCSTQEHEAVLKAKYPDYEARRQQIEEFTRKSIEKQKANPHAKMGGVITIPVVFHVVYKTAAQNIPDARLYEQIEILNKDFRRLNDDADETPEEFADEAADVEIEFCLAQVDPDGAPTTGILRVETTVNTFGIDDDVKFTDDGGSDAWPRDTYLNFWVCNLGVFLLGYAQFPGGPAATDGVVIHYEHVGYDDAGYPYHLGRTATHEVGHWLNLYHIWGDDGGGGCGGSDLVADTPNQQFENYGCPSFPETDACTPTSPGIMFMNYMDYVDDYCMNMFTEGQGARMRSLFEPGGERESILEASVCELAALDISAVDALPSGISCNTTVSPVVTIQNNGLETITSLDIEYSIDGGPATMYDWSGSLETGESESVELPDIVSSEGEHTIEITLSNPNGNPDGDLTDNTAEADFEITLTGAALPMTQGFESTGWPYSGYQISNPDSYYTWERTNEGASLGTWSVFMNHYDNDAPGSIDDFILPGYDFSEYESAFLTFDVAYALYTASGQFSDTLEVLMTNNCGETWQSVYKKANPDLQTADPITGSFEPDDDEWRLEIIEVSEYIGDEQVFVKFRTISDYENNLYVDNINIVEDFVAVQETDLSAELTVYPNPADNWINVATELNQSGKMHVIIYDVIGKVVLADDVMVTNGMNTLSIGISSLPAGFYQVGVSIDGVYGYVSFVKE